MIHNQGSLKKGFAAIRAVDAWAKHHAARINTNTRPVAPRVFGSRFRHVRVLAYHGLLHNRAGRPRPVLHPLTPGSPAPQRSSAARARTRCGASTPEGDHAFRGGGSVPRARRYRKGSVGVAASAVRACIRLPLRTEHVRRRPRVKFPAVPAAVGLAISRINRSCCAVARACA